MDGKVQSAHGAIASLPAGQDEWWLVAMGAALLTAAVLFLAAGWRLHRDRQRLCDALDQFGESDFQSVPEGLDSLTLKPVAEAWDRLMPRVQTAMAMLEWSARHDPITDLLNSVSFKLAVQAHLAGAQGQGVLLVMGVSELKKVNDSLGHAGGDQMLCALADRLRLAIHALADGFGADEEPLAGRLGGDEFALFLPGEHQRADIERYIQRLQRALGEPLHIGSQSLRVKLSIGVAVGGAGAVEPQYDQLLAAADSAMSRVRSEGQGGYLFFSPAMRRAADEILEKELAIRHALERGEFCLHYQPQFNLRSGIVDSVEALIRWNHPTRGLVFPGDFIPFAETYGLIDDIGDWVMMEAIRTAARWNAEGRPLRVSINVSPKQLYRIELIPMIRACLARFSLPPELLEIEITEAAIMRHEEFSLQRIEGLRRDGVAVALDDFGTGYSNIAQLMSLPMDRLKLDRSLLDAIVTDRRQQVVAVALIGLGRELGYEVVAEGVEDERQFALLKTAGCDYIQGYYLAKPLPEADLFARIAAIRADMQTNMREVPDRGQA
ncbi:GGDEF domain-containing protein [Novosphingobium umbonatum]|uniref:GGDEF domain-containing protein n=1 Tax=Novosphingobium umbonatum TaxID=1908524 RepID=A0A3S2X7S0_9SPHN|nr:GGDEF domain-containing protein [Novosphingobium umbonatum]